MLAGYRRMTMSFAIMDPTADARVILFKVPSGHTYTVESGVAAFSAASTADTANYIELSLENGGTAGTAQTLISGTAGGTAGWVAQTPQALTVTAGAGDLTEGQHLVLRYNETGTVAPGVMSVCLDVVDGIGAKA